MKSEELSSTLTTLTLPSLNKFWREVVATVHQLSLELALISSANVHVNADVVLVFKYRSDGRLKKKE